jgi:hypothetical protein
MYLFLLQPVNAHRFWYFALVVLSYVSEVLWQLDRLTHSFLFEIFGAAVIITTCSPS